MPIIDYEQNTRNIEKRVFNDPTIPQPTKQILQRFLTAYDVSEARRGIFLSKIHPILKTFDPIESALNERDLINQFFADIRIRYSPATYATYISVTRRFLAWLNQGECPVSMCDIKPTRAMKIRRKLKAEDMLTWEDGKKIADAATSTQLAAIVITQLDCGFRPSEFIDLNYGDVKVYTGLSVFQVHDGKTGGRIVVAHRCFPMLLKWLDAHPTKRAGDPLWIAEDSVIGNQGKRLSVHRYAYPAMRKRIFKTGRRVGIDKPMDMYNFRHSSCVLDKLDNLPTDLAAERHGHSVKHYVETYGRLSVEDVMQRFHSHYGTETEEAQKIIEHRNCPTCKTINEQTANWCSSCGTPLNSKGAITMAEHHGILKTKDTVLQTELNGMKEELAASREREHSFRKEQEILLQQMQEIRTAITSPRLN